jgi:hypothetical protein
MMGVGQLRGIHAAAKNTVVLGTLRATAHFLADLFLPSQYDISSAFRIWRGQWHSLARGSWHISCMHNMVPVGTYAHSKVWRQDERLSTIKE